MNSLEDMGRIRSESDRIVTGVAPHKSDSVQWGRAWHEALAYRGVGHTLACCGRVILTGGKGEAEEARRLQLILRRGWRYAERVAEIERDWRDLYPLERARVRLKELGEPREGESLEVTLDRAMMRNRVSHGDSTEILRRAHQYVRNQFPELEVG